MKKIVFAVDLPDDIALPELNELCGKVAEVLLAPSAAYEDRAKCRFGSRFTRVTITTDDKVDLSE